MNKIGQYEVRELLGEGGIGQVHVALDTALDREVAIKSLRPELLSDSNFVDRFRAEATSLARLNHPNITTLYSLLPDGRNLYMVMERVRGHPLDAILEKRRGPLGIREALAIMAQAADGLGYAHSMGVIHRDIKPSNLMVAENGLVKVMDFGIARVRGSQRLTRDGSIVGTLAYMAPEQLRGEPGDERSDIYSLGIVLYEMLSGAPPFRAESDYEIMQAQINKRPERLGPRVPGLDSRIEAALMRALAKKPEQRFASMRAFSDALGASSLRLDAPKILHDDTRLIEPQDLPPIPPQSGFGRVGVRIAMAAAVVVAVAGGAAVIFVPGWQPSKLIAGGAGGAPAMSGKPATPAPPKSAVAALTPARPGTAPRPAAEKAGAPRPAAEKPAAAAPAAPSHAIPAPEKPAAEKLSTAVQPGADKQTSPMAAPAAAAPAATAPAATAPAATSPAAPAPATAAPAAAEPAATSPAATEAAAPTADAPTDAPSAGANATSSDEPKAESTPASAAGIDDVTAAIRSKEYGKAAQLALPLAEAGNREAQFILGRLYALGQGVAADPVRAAAWYQRAADQGFTKAQYYLGLLYENGRGVPQSDQEAATWYRKAAGQGDPEAQNDLGIFYAVGQGVPRDDKLAVMWYQMSADQGYAKAQKNLGDMYLLGRGMASRNDAQAMYWYLKSAQQGRADAQYMLGYMYEKGRGIQPDEKQAADWYQKAAQGGSAEAQKALDRIRTRVGGNQ